MHQYACTSARTRTQTGCVRVRSSGFRSTEDVISRLEPSPFALCFSIGFASDIGMATFVLPHSMEASESGAETTPA